MPAEKAMSGAELLLLKGLVRFVMNDSEGILS